MRCAPAIIAVVILGFLGCAKSPVSERQSSDVPRAEGNSLSAEALASILTVLLSEDTPMVNLKHNLEPSIQISLPKVKGRAPEKVGDTALLPIDKSKAGLRLEVSLVSVSFDKVQIRADVTFWDPKRGFAADGAEWQELVFHLCDGKWVFHHSLGGAIK